MVSGTINICIEGRVREVYCNHSDALLVFFCRCNKLTTDWVSQDNIPVPDDIFIKNSS